MKIDTLDNLEVNMIVLTSATVPFVLQSWKIATIGIMMMEDSAKHQPIDTAHGGYK